MPSTAEQAETLEVAGDPPSPRSNYDRSSLTGDFMVMIPGQTAEDFELYAPETQYCEYFDGVIYLPSPVTDRHQEHVGFFLFLLYGMACEGRCGTVLMGPAVLRLTPEWKPEPDIFVRPIGGGPDSIPRASLVIEILSRSTRAHDLGRKLDAFRETGIPEAWFVDDQNHQLIVERKVGDVYRREVYAQGPVLSAAIPGFWIDTSWLWEPALPNARRCLDAILAGPPPA